MDFDVDDELRTMRRRMAELENAVSRRPPIQDAGARSALVRTVSEGAYPAEAVSTYAVLAATVGGDDTEGAEVTLDTSGDVWHVVNVGSAVPPEGTYLVATMEDSEWTVRYDG